MDMEQALYEDLGRASLEAYFCDIGSLIPEIIPFLQNHYFCFISAASGNTLLKLFLFQRIS